MKPDVYSNSTIIQLLQNPGHDVILELILRLGDAGPGCWHHSVDLPALGKNTNVVPCHTAMMTPKELSYQELSGSACNPNSDRSHMI